MESKWEDMVSNGWDRANDSKIREINNYVMDKTDKINWARHSYVRGPALLFSNR